MSRIMDDDPLARQIQFLLEIDRLKQITRRTLIADGSPRLWDYALTLINDAVKKGYLNA